MKRNSFWRAAVVLLAVMMLALCGCDLGSGQVGGNVAGKETEKEIEIETGIEADTDAFMTGQPEEEKDPVKIVFAVKSYWYNIFKLFVDSFNEKHSDCQVILKTDFYKSKILEEAQIGEGPVLIDTYLTGFEEQKDLWEPLDDLYEREELQDAFFDSVVDVCRIDGSTYGVISYFEIETCFTKDPITSEEWTYEYFMTTAKERELDAIFYGDDEESRMTVHYLLRNFEDSYILDLDKEGYVNEDHLNEVLDLVDRYAGIKKDKKYDWNQAFREGKVLCQTAVFGHAGNMFYARKNYGWDISFVGYPSPEGGKNYINAYPIAIRNSASEEEKRIAREFLLEVLSYDGQMNAYKKCKDNNYEFSIRRDVFENQCRMQPSYIETLKEMVESAEGRMYHPRELVDALSEAVSYHFENQTTREELLEKLQKVLVNYLDRGEGK